jgi:hypothetical protein
MHGHCYIDGTDIYDAYGASILRGGYNDLLTFPAFKELPSNDWAEEDGIDVDLSEPAFESREISIPFIASKAADLIYFLSAPGYHLLHIPPLERIYTVRLIGQSEHEAFARVTAFTLRFAQDVPVRPQVDPDAPAPDPGLPVFDSKYEIDDIPFCDYGITVLEAKNDLLKSPPVKANLSRSIQTGDGRIYDADHLVFQSKEATFRCSLNAVSMTKFWQCYDAFFAALTAPNERELYADHTGEIYPCFYKSTSGWTLHKSPSKVIAEFSLTLVFTTFRVGATEYLLTSEAGDYIVLEDNETHIDMNDYGN